MGSTRPSNTLNLFLGRPVYWHLKYLTALQSVWWNSLSYSELSSIFQQIFYFHVYRLVTNTISSAVQEHLFGPDMPLVSSSESIDTNDRVWYYNSYFNSKQIPYWEHAYFCSLKEVSKKVESRIQKLSGFQGSRIIKKTLEKFLNLKQRYKYFLEKRIFIFVTFAVMFIGRFSNRWCCEVSKKRLQKFDTKSFANLCRQLKLGILGKVSY